MYETRRKYLPPEIYTIPKVTYHEHLLLLMGGVGSGKSSMAQYIRRLFELGIHNMDAYDVDDFRTMYPEQKNTNLVEAHAHHMQHARIALRQSGIAVAMIGVYGQPEYREDKKRFMGHEGFITLSVVLEVSPEERLQRILNRPKGNSDIVTESDFFDAERGLSYQDGIDLRVSASLSPHRIWSHIVDKQFRSGLIKTMERP